MKRNLLLSLSLCAAGLASQAETNIYLANLAGWNETAMYSRGDDTEIFGEWPGSAPTSTETISGVTYDKFVIADSYDGLTANIILNNNNNGSQVDIASLNVDGGNHYYATNGILVNAYSNPAGPNINFDPVDTFVYILDNTGWDNLYVYGWGTNAPEIFGGWPGKQVTDTEMKGDVINKVIRGVEASDKPHCLIPHNNEGTQYDIEGTYHIDRDIYLMVTPDGAVATSSPAIAADITCEEAYFTLQGIRVAEPENGKPYMVKKGAEAGRLVMTSH